MAPPTMLKFQAPIRQAMSCLLKADVQVPSAAVMNFPRLALSTGAAEVGRRVSPRSRCSPALSEVRAMKLKWGKLGKRHRRPCTSCPALKTKKKSQRARKQSISRSKIWLAYAPPVNHNYTDCDCGSPGHKTRIKSCRTTRLKNASWQRCWSSSTRRPPISVESPPPPRASAAARGRGSHDVHAEWRKAVGVRREVKSFNFG
jgi:hypothetical protein